MHVTTSSPASATPCTTAARIKRSAHRAEAWAKRELLVVRESVKLVGQSYEPAVTIRSMLHLVSELLDLKRGRVVLRNGVQNEIAIAHAYGLEPDEIRRGVFKVGEGITGRTFKTGGILIAQDIDDEPLYLRRTVSRADLPQETVSFLALPITIDGAVEGVLAVYRLRRRDRALADDLQILQIVASLVGQILNISRLANEKIARLETENGALKSALARAESSRDFVGKPAVPYAAQRLNEQTAQADAGIPFAVAPDSGGGIAAHPEAMGKKYKSAQQPTPTASHVNIPPRPKPALPPFGIGNAVRLYQSVDASDRDPIEDALRQCHNNKSRAAQFLGLTLRQLNYRMTVLDIGLPERMP